MEGETQYPVPSTQYLVPSTQFLAITFGILPARFTDAAT